MPYAMPAFAWHQKIVQMDAVAYEVVLNALESAKQGRREIQFNSEPCFYFFC